MGDWASIETEIARIAESDMSFAPNTIANAREFLAFLRGRCIAPTVGRGYWPTFSFNWDIPPRGFEVEVFGDHLELYRFYDGRTEIKQIAHAPGEPFPPGFWAELPLISVGDNRAQRKPL